MGGEHNWPGIHSTYLNSIEFLDISKKNFVWEMFHLELIKATAGILAFPNYDKENFLLYGGYHMPNPTLVHCNNSCR